MRILSSDTARVPPLHCRYPYTVAYSTSGPADGGAGPAGGLRLEACGGRRELVGHDAAVAARSPQGSGDPPRAGHREPRVAAGTGGEDGGRPRPVGCGSRGRCPPFRSRTSPSSPVEGQGPRVRNRTDNPMRMAPRASLRGAPADAVSGAERGRPLAIRPLWRRASPARG